jgi:hypothetical protein
MSKRKINWPLTLCLIGGIIALIGEVKGANDKEPGDTISEWYQGLPSWVKHLISWALGAVCSHLWEWNISAVVDNKIKSLSAPQKEK